jgi:hypothetical protein
MDWKALTRSIAGCPYLAYSRNGDVVARYFDAAGKLRAVELQPLGRGPVVRYAVNDDGDILEPPLPVY